MTFWDHLSELARCFRRPLYVVIISSIFIMTVPLSIDFTNMNQLNLFDHTIASRLINDFQKRFLTESIELIPLNFFAPLEVYLFISFIIGTIISLPIAAYELYKFFSPALYKHEKDFALKFFVVFICLFAFGFVLGYLYIFPLSFSTMLSFSTLLNLSPIYNFTDFFSLLGITLLMCGLLFTFPIYIYVLVKAGILETQLLTKNRKYLYSGILIIIAILDPDPTLITEGLTFLPIVILMEISIFVSKRVEKTRKEKT